MNIGYARISKTDGQDTAAQIDALKSAGAGKIFQESASGGRWDRPQLHKALEQLRPGDVFIVWKLDRLSRSLKDRLCWLMGGGLLSNPLEVGFTRDKSLIFPSFKYRMQGHRSRHFGINQQSQDLLHLMELIEAAGAGFRSLTEAIDTTTPAGRMMMQMVGSFAEFERAMIRERTRAGLASARRRGRTGGRRHKLSADQREEIVTRINAGQWSNAEAARLFAVHPSTISRLLAACRQAEKAQAHG